MKDVVYMVFDEEMDWIYTIVDDVDEAVSIARTMNQEENPKYHHYVVIECSGERAAEWYDAWKKVMNL